jgi:hypothetical protein
MPINKGMSTNYVIKGITNMFWSDLDTQPIMRGMEVVEGQRQPSVTFPDVHCLQEGGGGRRIASTTLRLLHQAGTDHR